MTDPNRSGTEYDSTEISTDPGDYLNGPTGNQINRTSGGTTKSGAIGRVVEDDTTRTQRTQAGPTETAPGGGTGTTTTGGGGTPA